jgi:cytolysin (calcineurin-like family phosphatase)
MTLLSRRSLLASLPLLGAPLAAGAQRREMTFFVAGDSHFGVPRMSELNRILVDQLNELPGTPYPASIGGTVAEPRGVLFMGDMTDTSLDSEWKEFESLYGLTGKDAVLRYPVFEAIGNHDYIGDSPIVPKVKARHGDLIYSWDWDDVHFVCLDMHPDPKNLAWFARDVARAGRHRPLVIFFHYSIEGPYSTGWPPEYKEALARALDGLNVLGLFHGHYHHAGHYLWKGHEVFLPGSPRHRSHAFIVVRLTAHHMSVVYRDFDTRQWTEVVTKNIRR